MNKEKQIFNEDFARSWSKASEVMKALIIGHYFFKGEEPKWKDNKEGEKIIKTTIAIIDSMVESDLKDMEKNV